VKVPVFGVRGGSGGHHCWIFRDSAEFQARVRAFLSEGLRRNERVLYIGEGSEDELRRHVGGIGFDEAISRGAARVASVSVAYGGAVPTEIDAFADDLDATLAEGYTGLRVAANATSLAMLESWNSYEHMVDRFMVGRPLIGLCGFDGRRIDARTAAELECLHPITNTAAVGFRLTACSPAADRLALTGDLDSTNHDLLVRLLRAADLRPADRQVTMDVHGLRFVDHRTILLLRDYAADRGATLTLLDPRPGASHIVELLDDATIRIARSR
jgi:hypothetical protein